MAKTYNIPVTITFTGTIKARAENRKTARKYVKMDFWGIVGTLGTNDDNHIIDWDICTHHEDVIINYPKRKKHQSHDRPI
jgi:hypothetical protein